MLKVTRKVGQRIFIEEGRIIIEVAEIRGDYVKIGVSAPGNVVIDREEIHLRKLREKEDDRGGNY
jgi:carbon storage regulator